MYKFTPGRANFSLCSSPALQQSFWVAPEWLLLHLFLPVHLSLLALLAPPPFLVNFMFRCVLRQLILLPNICVGRPANLQLGTSSYPKCACSHTQGLSVCDCDLCARVYLYMWMNVELLIPVCIFYPLDQCIDPLAKLEEINSAAVFTAEVQLLCLQMHGCRDGRMNFLKGSDSQSLSFKNGLS